MSEQPSLTADQLHILQHSLGVDEREEKRCPYRNHYVAAEGQTELEQLVALGMMTPGRAVGWMDPDDRVYRVTEAGRAVALAALPPVPKRTRSQARYRRYMRVADLMSFREFMDAEREETRRA